MRTIGLIFYYFCKGYIEGWDEEVEKKKEPTTKAGSNWCVLCDMPNETNICVGCGGGFGQRFAHVDCYDRWQRGKL